MKIGRVLRAAVSALCALGFAAGAASAQVVGIGTTKGGANAAIGAAIAKVVSDSAGFQMRPQKMGGTQQYMPVVDAGELEFGLSNVMQYGMAVDGTGMSEGVEHGNLRLVATLMQFRNGVVVGRNSGIDSLADLKGKRVPAGYSAAPLFAVFMDAFLASAGLGPDDVEQVPVVGLPQSWDAFKQGLVDCTIIAAGAGPLREMEATIEGGVKYVPAIDNEIARGKLPRTRFEVIEPNEASVALREPTLLNVYEYVVFANASVPDETVRAVVEAIWQNEEDLRASSPLWKTYDPKNIARDFGLAYHPGAVAFYRDQGLWNR
ncbi:MAG TPA: TAXI family TRAP transporter solute-binding subunit [Kiloniellales bacterium]|nr:TAXI family TRAP transporter solute-binding subunit [Kiloniellales bacterium]